MSSGEARSPAPREKWRRVLAALIARDSINRFQAEQDPAIRDHCLPSTISELQAKGLRIDRQMIDVAGFAGECARVACYWLHADQRARALELLGMQDNAS